MIRVYLGDCLREMDRIKDKSVDLVLCDLPYGKTAARWDVPLDLTALWKQYRRVLRDRGVVALFGSQPFSSELVMSNFEMFKYDWIWEKSKASNFLQARKMPLRAHEEILVFYRSKPVYNPQMREGRPYAGEGRSRRGSQTVLVNNVPNPTFRNDNAGVRFPRTVQYFVTAESEGCYHPTQKPVALCSYLIKTYTNLDAVVLDNCAGSGTTGVSCVLTGRHSILIEKDPAMIPVIRARLALAKMSIQV